MEGRAKLGGHAFTKAAARLVAEQLESFGLAISAADAAVGRGLEAARLFREGDAVPASALFFDEEELLQAWLRAPGNGRYRDRVVSIPGVLKQGEERTVFAILVGAAQYVNAFTGLRKSPNAKLVFTPRKGFNEGALELRISTRNQAGVAKGSPLLIDYGPAWAPPRAGAARVAFKGALDAIFDQQKDFLPEDAKEHEEAEEAEAAAAASAAAIEAQAEAKRKAEREAEVAEAKRRKREEEGAAAAAKAAAAALAAGVAAADAKPGQFVAAVAQPPSELRLLGAGAATGAGVVCGAQQGAASTLALLSLGSANKRLPKHTILAEWRDRVGMSTKSESGPPWAVQPKDLVILRETRSLVTMASAMRDQYSAYGQIFGYHAFPKGSSPKSYTAVAGQKPYRLDFSADSFAAQRDMIAQAIEVARTAPGLALAWVVKGDEGKQWVRPCGSGVPRIQGWRALRGMRAGRGRAPGVSAGARGELGTSRACERLVPGAGRARGQGRGARRGASSIGVELLPRRGALRSTSSKR